MTTDFCCPKCKTSIVVKTDGYSCYKCEIFYPLHDGYVDFINESEFYAGEVSQSEMKMLIHEIDSFGYDEGLARFIEQNPYLRDYILGMMRTDWICHCLGNNNLRCLDIGSGLGNISDKLANVYQEVYSLEAVKERIEFQKRRYKNSGISNITIVRANALELPFPDNYFDLVVCNGVLEWAGMMNKNLPPRSAQISFLQEIKRVLSNNGCLYIGIENRFGLWYLRGAKDHSGLPYTSLLPRKIASLIVQKFGYAGGMYGGKSKKQKEQRGYYTYTYSIWGYRSLFQQAGFKFKSYWVFPSYNAPYFSGKLNDKIGVKGFFNYFQSIVSKRKRLLSIIAKLDKSILGLMMKLVTPSFLFYCYKNDISESIDDDVTRSTALNNYTTMSQRKEIMYLLYDKKGNPVKVVRLKRYEHNLPSVLPFYDKTNPKLFATTERIWSEDWIPGKRIDPLKLDEMTKAVEWLISFQSKTNQTTMTTNDIISEVNEMKTSLLKILHLNTSQYQRWLDDYESYMKTLKLDKTAEHGDFSFVNILIDPTKNKIHVIDWDHHKENGNPLFDFIFLIIRGMQLTGVNIEEFELNLYGRGKFTTVMKELITKINTHFGFELNLDILIRYVILRLIIRNYLKGGPNDKNVVAYTKMLNVLGKKLNSAY